MRTLQRQPGNRSLNYKFFRGRFFLSGFFLHLLVGLSACSGSLQQTKSASTALAGEPTFAAAMVSPLTKATPLQVVSLFSYEAGESLISPATELAALVAEKRTSGEFGKEPLRTLMLEAPFPSAKRLLYIALGPRADFSLDRVRELGAATMRETLRLGVEQMAFAPVVRDQGVTTFPADQVAEAFVEGALVEWDSERRASPPGPLHLKEVTYEAGPTFISAVKDAIPRGVAAAHARLQSAAASK